MADKILLTTGRVSSEIFSKVLRARLPVIAALGGPTDRAVKLARVTNITLVGRPSVGPRLDLQRGAENTLKALTERA